MCFFFVGKKKAPGGARPPDVHRSPLRLIFGLRGLSYTFSGRVEEESAPSNISMRSGGDANPNFQEEIKTGQKTLFWRWKLVQGLQKCSVKLSNRNHHKSTLSGIYFGNVKDEIIWPSLHAPSWINLWTRSEKNLLGIMKIWIQDPALLLITIVSGMILKRSTYKEVSFHVNVICPPARLHFSPNQWTNGNKSSTTISMLSTSFFKQLEKGRTLFFENPISWEPVCILVCDLVCSQTSLYSLVCDLVC